MQSTQVVKLDVGGTIFTTTVATLLKAPIDSFLYTTGLSAAQSPRPVFIDRDPTHFRKILNFLRDGKRAALPLEPRQCDELRVEAQFYGLDNLSELLLDPNQEQEKGMHKKASLFSEPALSVSNGSSSSCVSSNLSTMKSNPQAPLQSLCYICKCSIDSELVICSVCTAMNTQKRNQSCDLSGRVAIVTGARIKIGFATALKLVRCGALVIGTTRFPQDAAKRFSDESDFRSFATRLHLYNLDLRKYSEIESFVSHVLKYYRRVDILINNAAQTIRYPPAYFRSAVENEIRLEAEFSSRGIANRIKQIGSDPFFDDELKREAVPAKCMVCLFNAHAKYFPSKSTEVSTAVTIDANRLLSLSNAISPGESLRDDTLFPPGQFDSHGLQLDLRTHNSWIQSIEDISPVELVEVQMVNAIAPFILISQLLPVFHSSPSTMKFIINVSSAEGQFHGMKAHHHPHTNMAKASLNMLTRTCGPTLAKKGIFMNAVDTGWVSKLGPVPSQNENRKVPLTIEDGAARVVDPIISALSDPLHQPPSGVFFKHFAPAPW